MSLQANKHVMECTYGQKFYKICLWVKYCKINPLYKDQHNLQNQVQVNWRLKDQNQDKCPTKTCYEQVLTHLNMYLMHGLCGYMSQWQCHISWLLQVAYIKVKSPTFEEKRKRNKISEKFCPSHFIFSLSKNWVKRTNLSVGGYCLHVGPFWPFFVTIKYKEIRDLWCPPFRENRP